MTGANGFVGRYVCKTLFAAGYDVLALVRSPADHPAFNGIETIVGDLATMGAWSTKLADIDHVVHCAANARYGSGANYEAQNVDTTANVLNAFRSRSASLERFVYVSTVGVIDRASSDDCAEPLDEASPLAAQSGYGRSKARAEALVAASGLPFVILRPALVVGADMRYDSHFSVFARWVIGRKFPARFDWTGRFSVAAVEDVAEAVRVCCEHPGAVGKIFMCGGTPIAIDEFFRQQDDAMRISAKPLIPLAKALRRFVPFNLKSMLLPALVVDDTALRGLGWQPRRPVADAFGELFRREQARLNPNLPPPMGQTLITGAASGLGRAMAERLIPLRSDVLLVDRDSNGLAELASRYPHARTLTVDLADDAACAALVASDEWRCLPVTELFACAGVGRRGEFAKDSTAQQLNMLRVNLLARVRLAHSALNDMRRAQFGRIVLIASSAAFQPLPLMTIYAASNAALLSFGEGLAQEVSNQGIHVLTVCPGGMDTRFQATAGVRRNAKERLLAPEVVVAAIWRALADREVMILVSARAHMMALAARLMPRRLSLRLWGHLMAELR